MTLLFKYILKQNECYFNCNIYITGLTFGMYTSLKLTYSRQQYDVEIHHLKIGYQFERKTINVDKNRKRFSILINFATTIFVLITVQTSVLLLIRD